jgi:hypothetical protein
VGANLLLYWDGLIVRRVYLYSRLRSLRSIRTRDRRDYDDREGTGWHLGCIESIVFDYTSERSSMCPTYVGGPPSVGSPTPQTVDLIYQTKHWTIWREKTYAHSIHDDAH